MSFGKKNVPRPGEKRRTLRQSENAAVFILLPAGERLPCVLKNRSDKGALLVVTSVLGIPAEFDLQLGSLRQRVAVVRRDVGKIAVKFV